MFPWFRALWVIKGFGMKAVQQGSKEASQRQSAKEDAKRNKGSNDHPTFSTFSTNVEGSNDYPKNVKDFITFMQKEIDLKTFVFPFFSFPQTLRGHHRLGFKKQPSRGSHLHTGHALPRHRLDERPT